MHVSKAMDAHHTPSSLRFMNWLECINNVDLYVSALTRSKYIPDVNRKSNGADFLTN